MKSYLRKSAASGTDQAKIEKLIARGWRPGLTIGEVLGRKPKRTFRRGGQHRE